MPEPTLTSTWWDRNRAKTLPSTGLGKALKEYERAVRSFEQEAVKNPVSTTADHVFMSVKQQLELVNQALRTAAGKCNKTLHKQTLTDLGKLTQQAMPKERKRLDDIYRVYDLKRQDAVKRTDAANTKIMSTFDSMTDTLAKTWRRAQDESAALDKAATAVMAAAHGGDRTATATLLKQLAAARTVVLKTLDEIGTTVGRIESLERPSWPSGLLAPKDPRGRVGDRFENNMNNVQKVAELAGQLRTDVDATVKDAEKAARGELSASAQVEGELTRLLGRMTKAAQELNNLTRDGSSHISNFWGAVDNLKGATTDPDRERFRKEAELYQGQGRQDLTGMKKVLDTVIEDMNRTLRAQPKHVVDSGSEPFATLLADIRERNTHLLDYKAQAAKAADRFKSTSLDLAKL
ncbi:hypothetical protein [Jatrophihabitans fulvus]